MSNGINSKMLGGWQFSWQLHLFFQVPMNENPLSKSFAPTNSNYPLVFSWKKKKVAFIVTENIFFWYVTLLVLKALMKNTFTTYSECSIQKHMNFSVSDPTCTEMKVGFYQWLHWRHQYFSGSSDIHLFFIVCTQFKVTIWTWKLSHSLFLWRDKQGWQTFMQTHQKTRGPK